MPVTIWAAILVGSTGASARALEAVDRQLGEDGRPKGDKQVGPRPGRMAVMLALEPDGGAHRGGPEKPDDERDLEGDVGGHPVERRPSAGPSSGPGDEQPAAGRIPFPT